MPNIQSSVNQALSTAGILANTSPEMSHKTEKQNKLERNKERSGQIVDRINLSVLNKEHGDLKSWQQLVDTQSEDEREIFKQVLDDAESVSKERFELQPKAETYDQYLTAMQVKRSYGRALEDRQLAAQRRAQTIATAKYKQRRNFMDYLQQMPVSYGKDSGTVGDLPKSAQQQIAKQYTLKDRQALMDRMDKEAENGKQQ